MNFVDPKEYDIPGLVRKNRYKTILPSKFLLFKSPRQGGVFHVLEGFAFSFPECMNCTVTTMYCPKTMFMEQQHGFKAQIKFPKRYRA